ncbi:hypothetical protein [Spiroplasma ixodetis]|uniref:hypothetical protein n=1 Tax=Spiroplasma ixodetis TaxID=2141 RepID=UPI002575F030|nr:hypothetical protein [Spiroplasma ixodetis]
MSPTVKSVSPLSKVNVASPTLSLSVTFLIAAVIISLASFCFCESFNDLPSTLFSKAALISFVTSTSVFLCANVNVIVIELPL